MANGLAHEVSRIDHGGMRFVISDAPRDLNLDAYVAEYKKHGVTDLVRASRPSYAPGKLQSAGIRVHDLVFSDGGAPPEAVIDAWLDLCDEVFGAGPGDNKLPPAVAVHCVAGLGRAPVLVAVALMEKGMTDNEAVALIRKNRRGALNQHQLDFLEGYSPRRKGCGCVVM